MGEIKKYTCDCGYSVDFFSGAGMRALNGSLARNFFGEELERVEAEGTGIVSTFLDNALAKCPDCRELEGIARLTYRTADGNSHMFLKDICQTCGRKMKVYENEEYILCPKCGETMKNVIVGNWD